MEKGCNKELIPREVMPVEVGLPRKDNSQGPRKNSASLTIFEGIYQAQIDEVKNEGFCVNQKPNPN